MVVYHGDTIGAMSLGKGSGFFKLYDELLCSVDVAPYPHTHDEDDKVLEKERQALDFLNSYLDTNKPYAFIIEPLMQGASGMRVVRAEFLNKFLKILKDRDVLIIFDEVMTGFYRTGSMFALNQLDVKPDIIALSKGLSAGFLPLSITMCKEFIYEAFLDDSFAKALIHGHSFTANSLGCAAACKSLEILKRDSTKDMIDSIVKAHKDGLNILKKSKYLTNFRSCGTMIACDVKVSDSGYTSSVGGSLKAKFLEKNALIRPLGNTIYLLPPYVISTDELYNGYDIIVKSVEEIFY